MKSYSKAQDEVTKRVASVLKKHHSDLHASGLKIDLICVVNDEEGAPAIEQRGQRCYGLAKIISAKERSIGRGDCEILIDEVAYSGFSDETRDAFLDHEISHFELVRNKHGIPKMDQNRRPKLKTRYHDHEFGWFADVATRHGAASLEVQQATKLFLVGKQCYFDFALKLKPKDAEEARAQLMDA